MKTYIKYISLTEKILLSITVLALCTLYIVGALHVAQYGTWPQYGITTQSWESSIFEGNGRVYGVLFIYQIFNVVVSIIGILYSLSKIIKSLITKKPINNIVKPVIGLIIFIFYIADPFGLLHWFLD